MEFTNDQHAKLLTRKKIQKKNEGQTDSRNINKQATRIYRISQLEFQVVPK